MVTTKLIRILLVGLLLSPTASRAQDSGFLTLSGTVTDPNNERVSGATVRLHSRDNRVRLTVTTGDDGIYRFERLAAGDYLLDAEAPGFAPVATDNVRVESGNTRANVELQLDRVREEVVVTAADSAQGGDEISKTVTVVGEGEIARRDEYSIAQALATVPGVHVQQLGGPGSFSTIKIRGLRNEDTAVLVDGLRLRDAASPQGDASGFIEDLIVTDIDRLEVLRGSASSLYGTNAIGGVLNIVSNSGGGDTRGSILVEGGGLGLLRGQARVAGGLGDDRFAYSVGVSHLNVTRGIDDNDAVRDSAGQGRVLVQFAPTVTLTGRVFVSGAYSQLNESPVAIGQLPPRGIVSAVPLHADAVSRYALGTPIGSLDLGGATYVPAFDDSDYARDASFFSGALTFAQRIGDRFGYSVSYQGLATDRAFLDGPVGISFEPTSSSRLDYDGRIHTINARASAEMASVNKLDVGYEFEGETFRNVALADGTIDSAVDVSESSHSFFVHDQIRLLDNRLHISAAFRVQQFTLEAPDFTPSASAPYASLTFDSPPNAVTGDGSVAYVFRRTGTKLRGHVGNGYRAPSLYERFGTYYSSFFGYSSYGDPRLHPERSISFDAGIDQTVFDGRLRATATYFYTRLRDVIAFDFSGAIDPATDPFGRFGGYLNTKGGLSRGVEASLVAAPTSSTDLSVSYTYTNADQRVPLIEDVLTTFAIPTHEFTLVATQRIGSRFNLTFDFVAFSNYLAPVYDPSAFRSRAFEFEGMRKGDLTGSYTIPIDDTRSLRVFGRVENVFDRNHFENGFRTPGVLGSAGLEFEF
jgi:vitamin B12 transporter